MNPEDILRHPERWKRISRQEAMRECAFRTVMAVSMAHGFTSASPFNAASRYHRAGSETPPGLLFFLKVDAFQGAGPKSSGSGASRASGKSGQSFSSKGTDSKAGLPSDSDALARSDPNPEVAPGPEKVPPRIRLTKLDCEWFAPLVDTVLIHYEITGDLSLAESVHLRIASQKKPDAYLLTSGWAVNLRPRACSCGTAA